VKEIPRKYTSLKRKRDFHGGNPWTEDKK